MAATPEEPKCFDFFAPVEAKQNKMFTVSSHPTGGALPSHWCVNSFNGSL